MVTLDELDAITATVPDVKEDEAKIVTVRCNPELVDQYREASKQVADWTVRKDLHGARLKREAEPLRIAQGRQRNELVKSVVLDGVLRYTLQNKFAALKAQSFSEVSAVFGADYTKYITINIEVAVNRKTLLANAADAEVVAAYRLLKTKGIIFDTRTGHPTETLYRDMTFSDGVRAKALSLGLTPQAMLVIPKSISR